LDWGRIVEELGIGPVGRFEEEGKAALVARHQDWRGFCDTLVSCYLMNLPVNGLVDMLSAATGWDFSLDNVLPVGERIFNLKRALNIRWGWDPKDERLPSLLLQPLEEGGTGGYVPDVERLLSDYYQARNWDRESGKPTAEKLLELDLGEAAEELY
jgi:aldehyde:ferredoxin oxidoreductase